MSEKKSKTETIKGKLDVFQPVITITKTDQSREYKPARTGPGQLAEFLQSQSEVYTENEKLKSKLSELGSGSMTKLIDPNLVIRSKWANRHEQSFADKEFLTLKAEIDGAGGNIQPIKVRPLAGQDGKYEIVFGHRRHQACLELGLPVLAMIEDLSEQDLFAQMDRENRDRKDLRPYEQGLMYAKALDEGLFPSLRKMATIIGTPPGTISKALMCARLPKVVVDAFVSPLDIQLAWGSDLTNAIQANPEAVLARAKEITSQSTKLSSKEVRDTLLNLSVSSGNTTPTEYAIKGKAGEDGLFSVNPTKKTIVLRLGNVDQNKASALHNLISEFLSG